MYKLYILGAIIFIYILFINNNIELFTLSFPKNNLKCKCDMDSENNLDSNNLPDSNNIIEKFTNYDKSELKYIKKLDRIYNIHKNPYDESAEEYYNNNFSYPIKPLNSKFSYEGSNNLKYKNIGSSNNKILDHYYQDVLSYDDYTFGLVRK